MPYCIQCGNQVPENTPVCPMCGADQQVPPPPPGYGMAPQGPYGQAQYAPKGKTSGLAIASLILGILGICSLGILGIIGIILGIVAVIKINNSGGELEGKGLAIGGIAAGAATLLLGMMMMAISVPNFLKFQAKAKQSQAKTMLDQAYQQQMTYQMMNGVYAESLEDLDFEPSNRLYAVHFGFDVVPNAEGEDYYLPVGVETIAREDEFVIVAVGNIDGDPTLDVWTIDQDRRMENVVDDSSE